jgi:hypothetical protein
MSARGHPKKEDQCDSFLGLVPRSNRTDCSKQIQRMSAYVSRYKPNYTRFETVRRHPIDLFMGGYWISNLKRLATASSQSPSLPYPSLLPVSTTASLKPLSMCRESAYDQVLKMEKWRNGVWGEVNRNQSLLSSLCALCTSVVKFCSCIPFATFAPLRFTKESA